MMRLQEIVENPELAARLGIEVPLFDRSKASSAIVHIGVGRFHRAHQAVYIQELMNAGAMEWGICGVCLMPSDAYFVEKFHEQAGYYTLVEQGVGQQVKLIGSILELIEGYKEPQAAIKKMADPRTQLVSLTVTEAGYFYHPSTGELQWEHPLIQHDLNNADAPKTIFGYFMAALTLRAAVDAPLTIQSCDNIQENGELLGALLRSFIAKVNPELLPWFESRVAFPNSMVDRITPATSELERRTLLQLELDDAIAIVAEPFRQWVLERQFAAARPMYEAVGVFVTDSVKPYERMKVRLLNAGHCAIGYLGALAGFETVHSIVQNQAMNQFLRAFLMTAASTVPVPEGVHIATYQDSLVLRFANPALADQTLRICKDGSAKVPGFLLPSLLELLKHGGLTQPYAIVLAAWYVFIQRTLENGERLDDANGDYIEDLFKGAGSSRIFYQDASLFGQLGLHTPFLDTVQHVVVQLQQQTVLDVLAPYASKASEQASSSSILAET